MFRIGRAADNDLALDDWNVADYHGELVLTDNEYRIEAIDPQAPTVLNAEPCTERILRPGDEIRMGATVLEYRADDDGGWPRGTPVAR